MDIDVNKMVGIWSLGFFQTTVERHFRNDCIKFNNWTWKTVTLRSSEAGFGLLQNGIFQFLKVILNNTIIYQVVKFSNVNLLAKQNR